jgi:hypothetical protein
MKVNANRITSYVILTSCEESWDPLWYLLFLNLLKAIISASVKFVTLADLFTIIVWCLECSFELQPTVLDIALETFN